MFNQENKKLNTLLETVCKYYCVDKQLVVGRCRKRLLVDARQLYCYLARKHTFASWSSIGSSINRDHSSAIHSCNKILTLKEFDKKVKYDLSSVNQILQKEYESDIDNNKENKINSESKSKYIVYNKDEVIFILKNSLDEARQWAIMYCDHSYEIIVREVSNIRYTY